MTTKRYFFLCNVSVFSRVCPSKEASPFFCILIARAFTTAGYKNYTQAFNSDKGIGKYKVSAWQLQQQDGMKNRGEKNEWKKSMQNVRVTGTVGRCTSAMENSLFSTLRYSTLCKKHHVWTIQKDMKVRTGDYG